MKDSLLLACVVNKISNWEIHVVVLQATSKKCTSLGAVRLFLIVQPIRSLFCGVAVEVIVTLIFYLAQNDLTVKTHIRQKIGC